MDYSIIGILALILNLIMNRETFRHFGIRSESKEPESQTIIRYSNFLTAANCYFIADIAWGILYEHHDIPEFFPFLYSACVFYYIFMFLTILTWVRYIVAYLDKKGRRSKIMLGAVWTMFILGLIYLMINRFHHFIFSFNDAHEYIVEPGRAIAFILQIVLYMVLAVYILCVAHKSTDREKVRHIAVGITCFVMDLFLILQITDAEYPSYAIGLMIGICVIHSFVEADEMKEKDIYDSIATSLAEDYDAMYYVDIETGEFREFSTSQKYDSMNVQAEGRDFYAETLVNIDKCVHPDDREFAKSLYSKEAMLKILGDRRSCSYKYRLMIGGKPKYFRFNVIRANDDRHLVLYEKDIDDEITAETMRREDQKKHITFSQIAESLAANYDVLYYVDAADSGYISYECQNIYGQLDMKKSGDDFYEDSRQDIQQIVHRSDRDLVLDFLDREHMTAALEGRKRYSIDFRIMTEGVAQYVRMTARKTSDSTHFIIGIENIDAEVQKEKQHLKDLNAEKELARRDGLTGLKNKTAYNELVKSVQTNIENGMDYLPFALVVCDANNLKRINDSEGHVAGDEYIKSSAALLSGIFAGSPVFRVGGDEFVVFLRGDDYTNRAELMERLHSEIRENLKSGSGPILASGMSEYNPETDNLVSEIFDRADREMYEDKQSLKKEQ
ncbi:MAG: diguanylate cyclase [Lachnospiraceae bacterium]|nr:diguanylate cyclase [Lachnospiraceae bacterium]